MSQIGIRSIQHAEVRQPRHIDTIERLRAALPDLFDRFAALAEDADRIHELDGAEAGFEDDEVEVVGLVGGFDAGRGDGGDGVGAHGDCEWAISWDSGEGMRGEGRGVGYRLGG